MCICICIYVYIYVCIYIHIFATIKLNGMVMLDLVIRDSRNSHAIHRLPSTKIYGQVTEVDHGTFFIFPLTYP